MSEEKEFLYDWEIRLELTIGFPDGKKLYSYLSRVHVDDYDLLNMGGDDRIENMTKVFASMSPYEKKRSKFLDSMEKLGFVHGFSQTIDTNNYFTTTRSTIAEQSCSNETVTSSDSLWSSPRPNRMDFFTDVHYKKLPSIFGKKRFVHISRKSPQRTHESIDFSPQLAVYSSGSGEDLSISDSKGDDYPMTFKDKQNFDFGFDPIRDKCLIAKNANKLCQNDPEIMKYWYQRYRLFSKLNENILMDREGWFSVTPERIAEHVANRMVTTSNCIILDAFTGVGGNAIQFAKRGAFVYAIDMNPIKLRCAAQNARVYGVADRISFICGDFFHIAKMMFDSRKEPPTKTSDISEEVAEDLLQNWYRKCSLESETQNRFGIDAVFLSPPWGGPSYLQEKNFDLSVHVEPNGMEIFHLAKRISPNICYFLPRNTQVKQLMELAGPGNAVEIEQSVLNGKVKTISAYYGNLIAE